MATMGRLSFLPLIDPKKPTSPKLNTAPSDENSLYPDAATSRVSGAGVAGVSKVAPRTSTDVGGVDTVVTTAATGVTDVVVVTGPLCTVDGVTAADAGDGAPGP